VVAPAIANASVIAGVAPARPTMGSLAVLSAKVTNHGPNSSTIRFSDNVPAGLSVEAASASGGACSRAGQLVSCSIPNLASGHTSTVSVIVLPKRVGTFTNSVRVQPAAGIRDPNKANNSSTATMKVLKPGPTNCTVPNLKATPASVAENVLKLLGCTVKTTTQKGHGVPTGTVLSTNPAAGTYTLNRLITIIIRK
jgi:hypothetical protein